MDGAEREKMKGKIKNPKHKNLEELKMCENDPKMQMCRQVGVYISIYPCIYFQDDIF